MYKCPDLTGIRSGMLLVKSLYSKGIENKDNQSRWLCICDCGNESIVRSGCLKGYTKSCGCLLYKRKKYFDINLTYYKSIQKNALSRDIKFDVSIDYIWNLFLKQDRKCVLSGLPLTFPKKNNNIESKKSTASLDRIDSSKGYTKDNVQWIHKDINRMKNVYQQDYFIEMCKLISNNHCEIK